MLLERAKILLTDCYAEKPDESSRLYPGVTEGLDYTASLGCPIGLVTNKPGRFTVPLIQSLGIHHHFNIIVSGDTLPQQKPDPAPLLHCADRYGVEPARSVMVGDSVNDVAAARAAGMPVLCVSYGYNHGTDIRAHKPDAILDSLAELPSYLYKQCR